MKYVYLDSLLPVAPIEEGHLMKGRIDRIDVRRDHRELVALFYRIELQHLIMRLLYERSSLSQLSITG